MPCIPGGARPLSGGRSEAAVSYTHLAVYKRQVLGAAQIALKNLDLSGQILAGRIPLADEGPDVLAPFDPVSYTHLCRYLERRMHLHYDPLREVLVTVGGSEAIDMCIRTIVPVSYTHLDVYKRQ